MSFKFERLTYNEMESKIAELERELLESKNNFVFIDAANEGHIKNAIADRIKITELEAKIERVRELLINYDMAPTCRLQKIKEVVE